MVVLLIHPAANTDHKKRIKEYKPMKPQRRYNKANNYLTEIRDKKIYRVHQKCMLHQWRISVQSVENGRHIHKKLSEDAPKVLDISEKDKPGGQNKTKTDIEADQQPYGIEQEHPTPCKCDSVKDAEQHKHAQRQTEIYKTLYVLRQQKQVLRHIYLGKDTGVAHKGFHSLIAGLIKKRKNQVSTEQINGVMFHCSPKELSKHQFHNQQHQQRRN